MYQILLVIIYISFISLGLPDSLTGAAWPVMHSDLGVPTSYAGIITMLIAGGTIISSLLSDRLTRKLGAGLVTAISVLLTATALFGFSISNTFWIICLWTIPYGLGAGAVDAALNNYVALHFKSRHMSWLHCFWGIGAAVSPYIMSHALTGGYGWNTGYRWVSIIQIILTTILFLSLPIWKTLKDENEQETVVAEPLRLHQAVQIKGVPLILIAFFSYCALEATTGLWASTYLVSYRNVDAITAAKFASLFYMGITFGRFLCGFFADKFGDRFLIRLGTIIAAIGCICIMIPVQTDIICLAGLIIVGFGCAPIYPSIIHSTPSNFGKENSQAIIGIQMASAYTGSTFMPPLFGWLSSITTLGIYPFFLILFAILMFIMTEKLNKKISA